MKSFKRIVSIALALVLAFALCSTAFAIGDMDVIVNDTPDPKPVKVNPFITDDHFAYITGYPGNLFKPQGGLSRAEAATIFYRLLKDKSCDSAPVFSDVKSDDWFYTAVTTLASLGVIDGYKDGSYKPADNVSRAEFIKIAACFFDLEKAPVVKFTDVDKDLWYYEYISSAVAQGWIDNLAVDYLPDEDITRAEVVDIVNKILGREADEKFVDKYIDELVIFDDVAPTDDCFYDVVEAANGHDFKTVKGAEVWTGLAD